MLLCVRIVCSVPSTRVQIGTVGQFRQLHYLVRVAVQVRTEESESQIESVNQ